MREDIDREVEIVEEWLKGPGANWSRSVLDSFQKIKNRLQTGEEKANLLEMRDREVETLRKALSHLERLAADRREEIWEKDRRIEDLHYRVGESYHTGWGDRGLHEESVSRPNGEGENLSGPISDEVVSSEIRSGPIPGSAVKGGFR